MSATIVLSYRADTTGDRHANLLAVLRWLARTPQFPVIVVEQDAVPRLAERLPHPACTVLFAYNPGPFNKGWGLNVGVRQAGTPVLMFCNADLLVQGAPARWADACVNGFQVVKPYRQLVDLSPETTALVRASGLSALPSTLGGAQASAREARGEFAPLCGGAFVMRADAFYALGGWDERFLGWGGEDDAMSYKIERARLATLELDEGPALHLWHPRSAATTFEHGHYEANRALLARHRQYSEAERLRLAEVQAQLMGRREKYRPMDSGAAP